MDFCGIIVSFVGWDRKLKGQGIREGTNPESILSLYLLLFDGLIVLDWSNKRIEGIRSRSFRNQQSRL